MKTREDTLSLAETAKRWAKLEQEFQDRLSMGGFNTKAQDIDLFEAEEAMKEAAVRSLRAPTPPAAEAPGQEPVAWMYRWSMEGIFTKWQFTDDTNRDIRRKLKGYQERPLYAAPPTYADAEAKGFERGIEKAAEVLDNCVAAFHRKIACGEVDDVLADVLTSITAVSANAVAIRSLASPAPKGET